MQLITSPNSLLSPPPPPPKAELRIAASSSAEGLPREPSGLHGVLSTSISSIQSIAFLGCTIRGLKDRS